MTRANADSAGAFLVVGVDGSSASDRACEWAAAEARQRGLDVRIVAVWQTPVAVAGPSSAFAVPLMVRAARHRARAAAERGARRVAAAGAVATTTLVEGDPASVLLRSSVGADQLVVGDRGAPRTSRLLLGSVSSAVARRASVPVTVVHSDLPREGAIVCGVDGSPAAEAALQRAVTAAVARGTELVVVTTPAYDVTRELGSNDQLLVPGLRVRVVVSDVDPCAALVAAAEDASLLLVGRSSHSGLMAHLLGSVASACVHRARCPVQVVPPSRTRMRTNASVAAGDALLMVET